MSIYKCLEALNCYLLSMLFLQLEKLLHLFRNIVEKPSENGILYGELLYKCKKFMSEFKCYVILMDEVVTSKNLWIGSSSRSDIYSCFLF